MLAKQRLLAFTLALLTIAGGVRAASGDEDGPHFALTMARIQAYVTAVDNLTKAAAHDSKLADSLDNLSDADTPTAKVIAGYEASPAAKQALKAAGLTPQQFVYIWSAFTAAAFGLAYQQQVPANLDKVYDASNVEFYKAHQKELEALFDKGTQQTHVPSVGSDDQRLAKTQ